MNILLEMIDRGYHQYGKRWCSKFLSVELPDNAAWRTYFANLFWKKGLSRAPASSIFLLGDSREKNPLSAFPDESYI